MTRVLVATRNQGKLREYRAMLGGLPFRVISLDEAVIVDDVEETGATFAENAVLKATEYARKSGHLTLADDSGLEVDALQGQPGVRSARFGGPEADDRQRVDLLLQRLQGVPWRQRSARFHAAIAIATPEGHVEVFEGTCEGFITAEPRGGYGFGYDPVFYLPDYGRTMAEMPPEVKNQISHRAKAMRQARSALARLAICSGKEDPNPLAP